MRGIVRGAALLLLLGLPLLPSPGRMQDAPAASGRGARCPPPPTRQQRQIGRLTARVPTLCSASPQRVQVVNLCRRPVRLRAVDPSRVGPSGPVAREHAVPARSCPWLSLPPTARVELLDDDGALVARLNRHCDLRRVYVTARCDGLVQIDPDA